MNKRTEDLTGHIYNRWTVIKFSHLDSGSHWVCKCTCGVIKTVRRQGLIGGKSQSCGCFNREMSSVKNTLSNGEASFNKLYNAYMSGAKRKNRVFNLSKEDFRLLVTANCHYCAVPPLSVKKKNSPLGQDFIYNGIDRKNNNLGYTIDNCVSCCKFCNQAKHEYSYNEFIDWINKLRGLNGPTV